MQITKSVCSKLPFLILAASITASNLMAAGPVVLTVPLTPSNALIAHPIVSGTPTTLKGTSDTPAPGVSYTFSWLPGDGSAAVTGTVSNNYDIETIHTYTGAINTVYTAVLTVTNTTSSQSTSANYYVEISANNLTTQAAMAIDEGLWYLHKTQSRSVNAGVTYGAWTSAFAGSGYQGNDAVNTNAFEVNGHLESGPATDPYTETVARGMHTLFNNLATIPIANSVTNGKGTFNPDANGNGYGIDVPTYSAATYQGGMLMDAIVASGTPGAITINGPVGVSPDPGIFGRSYSSIVQDMMDFYAACQQTAVSGGGWYYNCNTQNGDNSISQWAAIGQIAGARNFGLVLNPIVQQWNAVWLAYSQNAAGYFGYQSSSPIWGPFAVTPSGMVQMAMDGIGRGNPMWDNAETYITENFANGAAAGPTVALQAYYYGMFSFSKSMLLHDPNGVPSPITIIQSKTSNKTYDWYADPTYGVATTLIGTQAPITNNPGGYWFGHNYTGSQYSFETAWAIIMLNRTVFSSGLPVAVIKANPNPAVAGAKITLDGTGSFDQNASNQIVKWEWDLTGTGTNYTLTGPVVMASFPAVGTYPVTLRVTDNGNPANQATTTTNIVISLPPNPPTASAGGPYNFCTNAEPWFLNGSGSTDGNNGQHEQGAPPSQIISYVWSVGPNQIATGVQPNVTAALSADVGQSLVVSLVVTDNTALAFPSSGQPNLTASASAQVTVRAATDPACVRCVANLFGRGKPTPAKGAAAARVDLTWTGTGADHYDVKRSTTPGGPYTQIGTVPAGTSLTYSDTTAQRHTTYYYVVSPASLNQTETCQSNQMMVAIQ